MLSIAEAVESGVVGLILSTLGTYLHSRRKGAEALDTEQSKRIEQLAAENSQLRIKPYEDAIASIAREAFAKISDPARGILRFLLARGETEELRIVVPGVSNNTRSSFLGECHDLGLIKERVEYIQNMGRYTYWRVSETLEAPLKDIIYPGGSGLFRT